MLVWNLESGSRPHSRSNKGSANQSLNLNRLTDDKALPTMSPLYYKY